MGKGGKKGKAKGGGGGGGDDAEVAVLEIPAGTSTGALDLALRSARLPLEGLEAYLGEEHAPAEGEPLRCWARCVFQRGGAEDTRFWPPALELAGEGNPTWTAVSEATASARQNANLLDFTYPAAAAGDGEEGDVAAEAGAEGGAAGGAAGGVAGGAQCTRSRPVPLAPMPLPAAEDDESGEVVLGDRNRCVWYEGVVCAGEGEGWAGRGELGYERKGERESKRDRDR